MRGQGNRRREELHSVVCICIENITSLDVVRAWMLVSWLCAQPMKCSPNADATIVTGPYLAPKLTPSSRSHSKAS